MSAFALDTSGTIYLPARQARAMEAGYLGRPIRWPDLDGLTQDYTAAVMQTLAAEIIASGVAVRPQLCRIAFHRFAPETVAAIILDCADFQALGEQISGRTFYKLRQSGFASWAHDYGHLSRSLAQRFPPLAPTVGDDGKVRFAS